MKAIALESKKVSLLKDAANVILASLLIGLCSKIAIPLFFTPVPITIQPSLILLFSVLLGSKRAFSMVLCLLAQAAFGLPVLSSGAIGVASFFGPTAGYLFGYLAGAYVTGFLAERAASKPFFSMAMGNLTIYALGFSFLSLMIGCQKAFLLGIAPFVLGDLLKLMISVKVLEKIRP